MAWADSFKKIELVGSFQVSGIKKVVVQTLVRKRDRARLLDVRIFYTEGEVAASVNGQDEFIWKPSGAGVQFDRDEHLDELVEMLQGLQKREVALKEMEGR